MLSLSVDKAYCVARAAERTIIGKITNMSNFQLIIAIQMVAKAYREIEDCKCFGSISSKPSSFVLIKCNKRNVTAMRMPMKADKVIYRAASLIFTAKVVRMYEASNEPSSIKKRAVSLNDLSVFMHIFPKNQRACTMHPICTNGVTWVLPQASNLL